MGKRAPDPPLKNEDDQNKATAETQTAVVAKNSKGTAEQLAHAQEVESQRKSPQLQTGSKKDALKGDASNTEEKATGESTPASKDSLKRKREPTKQSTLSFLPISPSSSQNAGGSPPKSTPASPPKAPPRLPSSSSKPSGYEPPSTYAHLAHLTDKLQPNLILVFVGLNPGIATATAGHAYAHRSNRFWALLHSSGLTPDRQVPPREDATLPDLYSMGHTNIVARPTKDQRELSFDEMVEGAGILEEKIRQCRPEAICLVGKGIWDAVFMYKRGRKIGKGEFHYGWQTFGGRVVGGWDGKLGRVEGDWDGAWVFVATSTSGLATSVSKVEREKIWAELGSWVQKRRKEKGEEAPRQSS